MKVMFIINVPAPYRVDFFNLLGQKVDLTVVYEMKKCKNHNDNWYNETTDNFKSIYLDAFEITESIGYSRKIKKVITSDYDIVIIGGYISPVDQLARKTLLRKNIKFLISSDGAFNDKDSFWKRILKQRMLKGANGYLITCDNTMNKYLSLGISKSKMYRYPFTSIKECDIANIEDIDVSKNSRIKILCVGRFLDWKGMDVVLEIAPKFPKCDFLFVGGEPTDKYIDIVNKEAIENVEFLGFQSKEEIIKIYDESDIFVSMTRNEIWGLVINEAMARGLPVITTNRCNAGLTLIENDINGYVIDVDSKDQLIDKLNHLIGNPNVRLSMAKSNIEKSHSYTIEKMVETHYQILDKIIKE